MKLLILAANGQIARIVEERILTEDKFKDVDLVLPGGGRARERWLPLQTAGVYIPGGRAFYPSTLAMTVIRLPSMVMGTPAPRWISRRSAAEDAVICRIMVCGMNDELTALHADHGAGDSGRP